MADSAISVSIDDEYVGTVEICRPPNNFFSMEVIGGVADALHELDQDDGCRAVVLQAQGKHFCAGADFSTPNTYTTEELYAAARCSRSFA